VVVYVVYRCAMRKWWRYAEVYVGTRTKFGEKWAENLWWRGSGAARGRMSGLDGRMSGLFRPDVRALDPWMDSKIVMRRGQIRAKFREICGWKLGKVDGKLDLPATHEIRESNPRKHPHPHKSQKNWGLFLWRIFEFGTKSIKQG